jgi:hypothetical protein
LARGAPLAGLCGGSARSRSKLTLTEFERPEIPEAENFAALPMMQAVFANGAKSPLELPSDGRPGFGKSVIGERFDWEKWQQYFKEVGFMAETTNSPPRDVLRALEHYAPQIEQWSQWKTRLNCRFALDLKAGAAMPLPHLVVFQQASQIFSLRLRAHLALGDSGAAYDDFRQGVQAYYALAEEPTVICGLVRISVLAILMNAIHDGLEQHAWTEPDLRKLDADLSTVRIWKDYAFSYSCERAFGNWIHETILATSGWSRAKMLSSLASGPTPWQGSVVLALIPKRVFRDNQLRHNRYFDEMLARVNAERTGFNLDRPTPSGPENLAGFDTYYFALLRILEPIYADVDQSYFLAKTRLDQVRVAIALERYRFARGEIPETLAELVPELMAELPRDLYTGRAMFYRRTEDDGFLLYSIGPNRQDDGGAIDLKLSDKKQRDWVWLGSGGSLPKTVR